MNSAEFNVPRSLRCELRMTRFAGCWWWRYVVEGRHGAVEFHVHESPMSGRPGEVDHYGGLETHSLDGDGPPDHGCGSCWALSGRPCWHDGSSSYAADVLIPRWIASGKNAADTFRWLANEYRDRFEKETP